MNSRSYLKQVFFILGAAALPLIGLGLLEMGLRAFTSTSGSRLFIPVDGRPSYQTLNPHYVQAKYFGPGFFPTLAYAPFRVHKPEHTFRVIALGASTTVGYPYHYYLGFPARLQERMERLRPDKHVEVINLGVTATNSFVLWDLAGDVVRLDPDAVVVYAGHNEYYGTLGTGNAMHRLGNRIWLKRLVLRLRAFALYRALEGLIRGRGMPEGDPGSMMARVIGNADLDLQGEGYARGIEQFEVNMREVLQRFQEHNIPVYYSTLISNLKDQPPLSGEDRAMAAFEEGHRRLAAGDTAEAREAFVQAKEWDGIRFRAPEAMNGVIRGFADQNLIHLVDLAPVVRHTSQSGLPDASFFDDHLHPNHDGYDALAQAFLEALVEVQGHEWARNDGREQPDPSTGRPTVHVMDKVFGFLQIYGLKVGYPFNKEQSVEVQQQALQAMLNRVRSSPNWQDRLNYRVMTGTMSAAEATAEGIRMARSQADTLGLLQLYLAQLYWRPFDATVRREALEVAEASPNEASFALLADRIRARVGNLGKG